MHKDCPNRKSLSCRHCFQKGHHWRNCDTRLFWQEMCLSSEDKSEFFRLSLIGKLSFSGLRGLLQIEIFVDVPENSGLVLSPTKLEFDEFEKFILDTYAANWEEHGGFIVRPPEPLKPDYKLMADLKRQKVTPLQQIYKPPPSKRDGVFLLTDLKDRKKEKGEKGNTLHSQITIFKTFFKFISNFK